MKAAIALLDRFHFDSILFPTNFVCFTSGHFGPRVVAHAKEKGTARLALKAMAYDFHFSFGCGSHNLNHGGAEFPAQMIWLWRGYDPARTEETYEMDPSERQRPQRAHPDLHEGPARHAPCFFRRTHCGILQCADTRPQ